MVQGGPLGESFRLTESLAGTAKIYKDPIMYRTLEHLQWALQAQVRPQPQRTAENDKAK